MFLKYSPPTSLACSKEDESRHRREDSSVRRAFMSYIHTPDVNRKFVRGREYFKRLCTKVTQEHRKRVQLVRALVSKNVEGGRDILTCLQPFVGNTGHSPPVYDEGLYFRYRHFCAGLCSPYLFLATICETCGYGICDQHGCLCTLPRDAAVWKGSIVTPPFLVPNSFARPGRPGLRSGTKEIE